MKPREAARLLAISERTLWSLGESGDLAYVKIGNRWLYPRLEIERFVTEQSGKGGRK